MWWMLAISTASLFPTFCLLYYLGERRDEKLKKRRSEEQYEKLLSLFLEMGASEKQIRKLLISEGRYDDLRRVMTIMEETNGNGKKDYDRF